MNEWSAEEDSKVRDAIAQHGYCQCRRRWKVMLPHAAKSQKDEKGCFNIQFCRLGVNDFIAPMLIQPAPTPKSDQDPLTSDTQNQRDQTCKLPRATGTIRIIPNLEIEPACHRIPYYHTIITRGAYCDVDILSLGRFFLITDSSIMSNISSKGIASSSDWDSPAKHWY
ncbi:hypothetical protein LXL04_034924 [Taraxacum kok-saghyz]